MTMSTSYCDIQDRINGIPARDRNRGTLGENNTGWQLVLLVSQRFLFEEVPIEVYQALYELWYDKADISNTLSAAVEQRWLNRVRNGVYKLHEDALARVFREGRSLTSRDINYR